MPSAPAPGSRQPTLQPTVTPLTVCTLQLGQFWPPEAHRYASVRAVHPEADVHPRGESCGQLALFSVAQMQPSVSYMTTQAPLAQHGPPLHSVSAAPAVFECTHWSTQYCSFSAVVLSAFHAVHRVPESAPPAELWLTTHAWLRHQPPTGLDVSADAIDGGGGIGAGGIGGVGGGIGGAGGAPRTTAERMPIMCAELPSRASQLLRVAASTCLL